MTASSVRRALPLRRGWAVAAALVLALTLVPLAGTQHGRSDAAELALQQSKAAGYTPQFGVKFNHPLSKKTRRAIVSHLARTINSTPSGERIRIASWNIKSRQFVDALVKAHRRGVGVRVLMSKAMADRQRPSGSFGTLNRLLAQGNEGRSASMTSYARGCQASCRGYGGIAHTKMYLFSQAGNAHDVVMFSSANFTETAATAQWNDMFTVTGRPDLFEQSEEIFNQMAADQKALRPYQTFESGDVTAIWYPYRGDNATGDPVVKELNRVQCKGTTGGAGRNGRTVIRIGQTALLGDPGMAIAKKLQSLRSAGCNIRLLTAVTDRKVRPHLKGLAWRIYTQDITGDGVYDRYIHMKAMSVNGVYNGRTDARVVWNGSANWSPKALNSDEAGFKVTRDGVTLAYESWIDRLFTNPPRNRGRLASSGTLRVTDVRVTSDGRVLSRAVLPDGSVVNPYAKVEVH